MKIRLLRWFVLHVMFAFVPILAPLAIAYYFLDGYKHRGQLAPELLFFTFMISSIACGEVVELCFRYRVRGSLAWLAACLLLGALWTSLLYTMTVQTKMMYPPWTSAAEKVWPHALFLAIIFLVLGTGVAIIFDRIESGKWQLELRSSRV